MDVIKEMRLHRDISRLRRETLEIARSIVEAEATENNETLSAEELELRACDLADAQVKEAQKEKDYASSVR